MKIERYTKEEAGMTGEEFFEEFRKHHKPQWAGSGACASVYVKGDVAYKVGPVRDNLAYLNFIEAVATLGTENKYLPKVYGVRIIGDYMIVALEKLRDDFEIEDLSKSVGISMYEAERIAYKLHLGEDVGVHTSSIKKKVFNEFVAALYVVAAAARKGGDTRLDMHSGNFMKRGNQIVITDPLVDEHI